MVIGKVKTEEKHKSRKNIPNLYKNIVEVTLRVAYNIYMQ